MGDVTVGGLARVERKESIARRFLSLADRWKHDRLDRKLQTSQLRCLVELCREEREREAARTEDE